tara:strand:+ start:4651 stop:4878 length:228 start_codon:yes stop_codon:yes gene_type:complete
MCILTPKKRMSKVPSVDELQRDIYKETLEHMVCGLIRQSVNDDYAIARDFDSYQSDDEEVIVNNLLKEMIDTIAD